MNATETPETDAAKSSMVHHRDGTITKMVDIDFARSLERRALLAEAKLKVAVEALNRAKELLDLFRPIDAHRALSNALAALDQIGKEANE
jgi:hypothetical protein